MSSICELWLREGARQSAADWEERYKDFDKVANFRPIIINKEEAQKLIRSCIPEKSTVRFNMLLPLIQGQHAYIDPIEFQHYRGSYEPFRYSGMIDLLIFEGELFTLIKEEWQKCWIKCNHGDSTWDIVVKRGNKELCHSPEFWDDAGKWISWQTYF